MHFEKDVVWSEVGIPWDSIGIRGEVVPEWKCGPIREITRRFISVSESNQNSNENGENSCKL